MRFFAQAHYDFLSMRRKAYMVSGAAVALAVAGALFWQATAGHWLNYGVDFTGGTLVLVEFHEPVAVNELRQAVTGAIPGSEVTRFGAENEFQIRAPQEEGTDAAEAGETIRPALEAAFGADAFTILFTDSVGAKVGSELQTEAVLAILLSFAATLVYLAIRFEWRFGAAAIIATVHDIVLTMGLLSVLQLDISLPTVAAVLTIIGYSLNDTIVIFDRIRENVANYGRREGIRELVNRSVNETLPRTVITSGTTLAVLVSLFLFGGTMVQGFAFILIVGIVLGTYSSIFVASPALLEIDRRWPAERKRARGSRRSPGGGTASAGAGA